MSTFKNNNCLTAKKKKKDVKNVNAANKLKLKVCPHLKYRTQRKCGILIEEKLKN